MRFEYKLIIIDIFGKYVLKKIIRLVEWTSKQVKINCSNIIIKVVSIQSAHNRHK